MTTEQYSIGYDEGYQDGWNAAMEAKPAQPQQEPVATVKAKIEGGTFVHWTKLPVAGMTLYTSPPAQRKPLTDELEAAFKDGWQSAKAAHGIKENT